MKRIIGNFQGAQPGKLFIAMAGIHGNETSGIEALDRIFKYLNKVKPDFKGTFTGLTGNFKAIKENKRYIDKDFNRIWLQEVIKRVENTDDNYLVVHEEKELKKLLGIICKTMTEFQTKQPQSHKDAKDHKGNFKITTKPQKLTGFKNSNILFVDLHNTSSSKGLFTFTFNNKINKQIASVLKIPIIMGLEKVVLGTAVEYFHCQGYLSLAFEGGKIGEESSVKIHEAGIWLLLNALGSINKDDIPDYEIQNQLLSDAACEFPPLTELAYVHDIKPEDEFNIFPGFENFQLIKKGELIAVDKKGPVYAPESGFLLMPLYQKEGGEGFFIIKESK